MVDVTLVDLVKITALTTGTGAVTLGDAVPGYRGQEALLDGAVYNYTVQQEAEYELGRCTYLLASKQIVRTPAYSSNGGEPINLQANAAIAFVAVADDILGRDVLRPLYGYGDPDNSVGLVNQVYFDLETPVTLWGPKTTSGWTIAAVLQGGNGAPGAAANTRKTLAELKAAAVTDVTSLYDGSVYTWTLGNFTGQADDYQIVASNNTSLSIGAWKRTDGPLYAGNFGVRDDPNVTKSNNIDQRVAVQAFEDLCASLNRDRNYGPLRIAIGSPGIVHRSGGLVFDGCSTGYPDPGFYALYGDSGYTILTNLGRVSPYRVMTSGWDEPTNGNFDASNNLLSDQRPQVNGQVFGGDQAQVETANRCVIEHAAAPVLGGVGIDIYGAFDCAFMQLTTDGSGKLGSPAFRVRDGNTSQSQTSNELFIGRLQVERAIGQAIDISVNTLSINVAKIHSEGARGVSGTPTWRIGAASSLFGPVRLAAVSNAGQDTTLATADISGANTAFVAYRGEGFLTRYSGQGADGLTMIEAGGTFKPFPGQNGIVRFRGGNITVVDADGYSVFDGCNILSMVCGFVAPSMRTTAINCSINTLSASSTQATLDLVHCQVKLPTTQTFGILRFLSGTTVTPVTGTGLTFGYQYVLLDEVSTITANVTADFACFDQRGKVVGLVNYVTAQRSLIGPNAETTAGAFNYAPPTGTEFVGPLSNAKYTKNPAWTPGATPGWLYATADSAWHPAPVVP